MRAATFTTVADEIVATDHDVGKMKAEAQPQRIVLRDGDLPASELRISELHSGAH